MGAGQRDTPLCPHPSFLLCALCALCVLCVNSSLWFRLLLRHFPKISELSPSRRCQIERDSRMRLFVTPPSWTTRKNRRAPLRTSIDLSGLLSVMVILLFIVMFGSMIPGYPRHVPADMPRTAHSTPQPDALREDALEVGITRDGSIYFRNTRISLADLPGALRESVRNGAEKTVYVKADARVKYGDVKAVIDQIHQSGLQNITFLTEQPPH